MTRTDWRMTFGANLTWSRPDTISNLGARAA